jgi:hypothetical protein
MGPRYLTVYALALRLLRGEPIEVTDQHGRAWLGSATSLCLKLPGSRATGPVLEDADAYEVAARLATLALPRGQACTDAYGPRTDGTNTCPGSGPTDDGRRPRSRR